MRDKNMVREEREREHKERKKRQRQINQERKREREKERERRMMDKCFYCFFRNPGIVLYHIILYVEKERNIAT